MQIVIRVDASLQIGSGHVMRCLTLAEELRGHRNHVIFICREHPGHLIDYIKKKEFTVYSLPFKKQKIISSDIPHAHWLGGDWQDEIEIIANILKQELDRVDWLIVDHYAIDYRLERELSPLVRKTMIIDDLADRSHACNLLLDQNFYLNQKRYKGLAPKDCRQLMGPQYALLRKQFKEARKTLRERNNEIKHFLVYFGGVDATNETEKALNAIFKLTNTNVTADVIIGHANPNYERLMQICESLPNIQCHMQIENMAEMIAKADLVIGAGGSNIWERCCLGTPSIILTLAFNQVESTEDLSQTGVVYYLGKSTDVSTDSFLAAIQSLRTKKEFYQQMIEKSLELVDGKGTNRILHAMKEEIRNIF